MPIRIAVDEGVVARHRNVIHDTHVAVLTTSDPNFVFRGSAASHKLLSVDYMKNFLLVVCQALQNDEILLRLLNSHDVDDLVFVGDFEREDLLTNLAVDFVEFQHHLTLVYAALPLGLKP